jgi:hypothetical protein
VDYYGEVIGIFVSFKYLLVDAVEHLQRVRTSNPTSFIVQTTLYGALLAFLGSYFSGLWIFIITLYSLVLLPGIIANRIPAKVYVAVEPYAQVFLETAKQVLFQAIKQAQVYIQKKQQRFQPPLQPQQQPPQQYHHQPQQPTQQPQQPVAAPSSPSFNMFPSTISTSSSSPTTVSSSPSPVEMNHHSETDAVINKAE